MLPGVGWYDAGVSAGCSSFPSIVGLKQLSHNLIQEK
jgi:hypothetical protein